MRDFAAIDFETANGSCSSVCSVGVVVVRGGEVAESFYSLIHPAPNYYAWFCQQVHRLCDADTCNAPLFPEVWEQIDLRIKGLPLVVHNAGLDERCLRAVHEHYGLEYPNMSSTTRCGHHAKPSDTRSTTTNCTPLPRLVATTWRRTTTLSPMPKPVHG